MPYTVEWYDEARTILLVSAIAPITWEEFHAVNDRTLEETKHCAGRVDVIIESRVGVPPGNPLPHFRIGLAKWKEAENIKMIAAVSASRMRGFIQASADIAGKLMGVAIAERVKTVETVEQAAAVIMKDRAKSAAKQQAERSAL